MHSTASDGTLTPSELMRAARLKGGVDVIALTDHDTVAGVAEARSAAEPLGMHFVPGIEISTLWSGQCIHVVGLGVDITNAELLETTARLSTQRDVRAAEIGRLLEGLGWPGMYEKALRKTTSRINVSRLHFAKCLLEEGAVRTIQEAFDRYLGNGRPAFVPTPWQSVDEVVQLIHRAGGVAVLAHPGRYRLASDWERDLLVESFVDSGGEAIEVVSGSQSGSFTQMCLGWARRFGLYASTGSDFHSRAGSRPFPGSQGQLPGGTRSVLDLLGIRSRD